MRYGVISALAGSMLGFAAIGSASGGASAAEATVQVSEKEPYGTYLTDGAGGSLYLFEADSKNNSSCYDACAGAWPPLTTDGKPVAGSGVDGSMLGTIERKDGKKQVTYGGWPLYSFINDNSPGDTNGQDVEGFGAEWYLVSPDGEKVEEE